MKQAFITPTAYLSKFASQGDLYLALAHLIDDEGRNEYTQFHINEKRKGRTVYLDNGLFEGSQVDPTDLIKKAKLLQPDVVCAPDILYDSKATIKEFKKFIKLKQEEGLVAKIMGIPQASSPEDWWDCFQFFDTNKDCDLIGLSILSVPKAFGGSITRSREHLIEQLYTHSILSDRRLTPMHMLGLGESYDDIRLATQLLPRDIISNDSSSTFVHGMCGVIYGEDGSIFGGKIEEKLDFSIETLNRYQEDAINRNIEIARRIANEYS